MANDQDEVLIVGAGVSGLTLSIALAMYGIKSTIYEKANSAGIPGYALQITPNGFSVLQALGLGDVLVKHASPARFVLLRNYESGKEIYRMDLASLTREKEQDYFLIHRPDLIRMLIDRAKALNVRMVFNTEIKSIVQDQNSVLCQLQNKQQIEASAVIGADGIASVTSNFLNLQSYSKLPDYRVLRVSLPLDTPGIDVPAAAVCLDVTRHRHKVQYRLEQSGLINIVVIEKSTERTLVKNNELSKIKNPVVLQFKKFFPEIDHEKCQNMRMHYLYKGSVAKRWHKGRVGIIGDALHPTLPFLAQGGNLALEDAYILASCMDQESSIDKAFSAFRTKRYSRVKKVVSWSNQQAILNNKIIPGLGPLGQKYLNRTLQYLPGLIESRYRWIFARDVTSAQN